MPTKRLPPSANMAHLKHQAKDLLADFRAEKLSALQRVREFHPKFLGLSDTDIAARTFSLSDAQLSIAREYGYASWPRLKETVGTGGADATLIHNDRIEDPRFKQALDFLDEGNVAMLRDHLIAHPDLVDMQLHFEGDNYFTQPTLIEFVAENPVRQDALPRNIVEIAQVILEAGAKHNATSLNATLELVASGRVAREAGAQLPLLELLCQYGADPAGALSAAVAHGEFAAAQFLIGKGAPLDLPTAVALDLDVQGLLKGASQEQLQLGLGLAALHGRVEKTVQLLNAGADPNRFNPPGGHSHCTPLHSAAVEGHLDTVKALVQGGARGDIGDIHHNATALGWAEHAGHDAIIAYLKTV